MAIKEFFRHIYRALLSSGTGATEAGGLVELMEAGSRPLTHQAPRQATWRGMYRHESVLLLSKAQARVVDFLLEGVMRSREV